MLIQESGMRFQRLFGGLYTTIPDIISQMGFTRAFCTQPCEGRAVVSDRPSPQVKYDKIKYEKEI